jgi:hypothetical protein
MFAMIGIDSCHRAGLAYTGQVRLNWRLPWLAIPVALALLGAGCAGINTSQSVSPLDFLLPGAGHFMKSEPPATNAPASFPEISTEVALNK